jgi:hypothetical protein
MVVLLPPISAHGDQLAHICETSRYRAVLSDVPVGNLRSEILVVQSAQNWHRQRATDSLDSTRDRRVLVQR